MGLILPSPVQSQMEEKEGGILKKIVKIAKTHKVDPVIAVAVADIESKFNPQAKRFEPKLKTYSVGLFQVLFTTARHEFAFLGSHQDLTDLDTNITYGVKYLGKCIKARGKSVSEIACCYNAGINAKASFCSNSKGVKKYTSSLNSKISFWKENSRLEEFL